MHVLARSSKSFAIPPHWDLQHPSPPRSRTAAGPNDDALWSATPRRACTPRYIFTTLMPMRTCPSWIEVENEVEMEMYTASRYAVGDSDEEARVRLQCRYRSARRRGRDGAIDAAPACACRWVLRMRMETQAQRRVWMYVLPIALVLALALGPVLAATLASVSRYRATHAQWTPRQSTCARARNVDVEAGAPFLAAYALPFLVERGLRMQRNACVHAHRDPDMTLGADVRAPQAGAGFAPPVLHACAEGRQGGDMALGVTEGNGEHRCSFEADAASECSPRERCSPPWHPALMFVMYISPLFSRLIRLDLFSSSDVSLPCTAPAYAPSFAFCTAVPISPAYLMIPYRVYVPVHDRRR
ncbi:hypothetical protein B0H13DRAFT_2334787 [Mycena leptocephala]|nr:hypothetical protein B0H13DRAFT_2334787 [Mycena leptocephala]